MLSIFFLYSKHQNCLSVILFKPKINEYANRQDSDTSFEDGIGQPRLLVSKAFIQLQSRHPMPPKTRKPFLLRKGFRKKRFRYADYRRCRARRSATASATAWVKASAGMEAFSFSESMATGRLASAWSALIS